MAGTPSTIPSVAGVTVLSRQRAGVFDTTTIQGSRSGAVLEWLVRNGYRTPKGAVPAIRDYVQRGWVFVASKTRRPGADEQLASLHPLAFIFPTHAPVYPTRLTAMENDSCTMDLYVFGRRKARARHGVSPGAAMRRAPLFCHRRLHRVQPQHQRAVVE